MKTEIVAFTEEDHFSEEEERALERAGAIIREGGLVAFPTETVYGLGGDALNPHSSKKIYAAKGRPSDNPLIIHISRLEDLWEIAAGDRSVAEKVAKAFWPGPLTLVLPKAEQVPLETTGGLNTVAVRFPKHLLAQKFITYSGGFVAAPSANLSGKPSPTSAKFVAEDMNGRIEMILDGGEGEIGLESTILDLTVTPPQILRPGYITKEMLEQVLDRVDFDITLIKADSNQPPRAPGMKYRHYAPKGELLIVEGEPERVVEYINKQVREQQAKGEKTGVIATRELLNCYGADSVKCIGSREQEGEIAKNLYTILRTFDDEGVTQIYSESFSADGLGQAIMNRLLKAAGHHVIRV